MPNGEIQYTGFYSGFLPASKMRGSRGPFQFIMGFPASTIWGFIMGFFLRTVWELYTGIFRGTFPKPYRPALHEWDWFHDSAV